MPCRLIYRGMFGRGIVAPPPSCRQNGKLTVLFFFRYSALGQVQYITMTPVHCAIVFELLVSSVVILVNQLVDYHSEMK